MNLFLILILEAPAARTPAAEYGDQKNTCKSDDGRMDPVFGAGGSGVSAERRRGERRGGQVHAERGRRHEEERPIKMRGARQAEGHNYVLHARREREERTWRGHCCDDDILCLLYGV